jgi:aldose 1-epimerase
VGAAEPAHATLTFSHVPRLTTDWPYRFDAEQHFWLDASAGLTVELMIVNLDDEPMPAGIGHHPYVPRRGDTRLTADVDAMWESDAQVLPTQLIRPPLLAALRQGVALQGLDLDNNFTGWSRRARVDWPDTGTALELVAEAPLDHFVIFCPPGFDHFCIEPVSNCTDWMNLAQRGPAQVGGQLLAPGERLRARFALQPHWPA